jgi:hypothetical protein
MLRGNKWSVLQLLVAPQPALCVPLLNSSLSAIFTAVYMFLASILALPSASLTLLFIYIKTLSGVE